MFRFVVFNDTNNSQKDNVVLVSHTNMSTIVPRAPKRRRTTALLGALRVVLSQVPTALLCFLDDATHCALLAALPDAFTARDRAAAQRLWGSHAMNEPFHALVRTQVHRRHWRQCCSHYKTEIDVELFIVRDGSAPFDFHRTCWKSVHIPETYGYGLNGGNDTVHGPVWEATRAGISLGFYAWRGNARVLRWRAQRPRRSGTLVLDVATLAGAARRVIVAKSRYNNGSTWHQLIASRSFAPIRQEMLEPPARTGARSVPVDLPARVAAFVASQIWDDSMCLRIFMILELSQARALDALVPLLETMPGIL